MPDGQKTRRNIRQGVGMQELLLRLDPDFYREARLHIARVELEQLRRERSAFADIERRVKIPSENPARPMPRNR